MNSSSQDTVLFHCYLAQSDISLPCGLFAAQVHHLTYVGIFKQIFSPREVCFIFGTTGLPADFTGPLILFPPFFLCAAYLCPPPHVPFLYDEVSHTVFHLPSELDSENIIPSPSPTYCLYAKPLHLLQNISRVELPISPSFFFFFFTIPVHFVLSWIVISLALKPSA